MVVSCDFSESATEICLNLTLPVCACVFTQKECIAWAWELLTERLHLPKDRLYVSYFGGDAARKLEPDLEAREIWISVG